MGVWVASSGEENPGPIVVLVHGAMDRSGSWVRVVRELRDLHTVRYDRRGYGRSRHLGGGTTSEHVADLFDVIADRECVVAGHSYGSAIALAAAEQRPDLVHAVVSYEGPMSWEPWWPARSAGGDAVQAVKEGTPSAMAAERFLRRYIGDAKWEALPQKTRDERRAEGEALLVELRSGREGGPAYDRTRISVPVISARGSESEPHLRRGAEVLASDAPHAELHEIAGANHGAHQSHPAEFANLIRLALARSQRTPAP